MILEEEIMDVLITSASRPKNLKSEIVCFLKHVKYSGEFNFHLHEDVVPGMESQSGELSSWARDSGIFTTVYASNPRIGRGRALNKLRQHANSKYVWYLEDDWDFIEDVDLDSILEMMDKHGHINQVAFFYLNIDRVKKPGGPDGLDEYIYARRTFDGHIMFVAERWGWCPAIWRKDFVVQTNNWQFESQKANKHFNYKFKHKAYGAREECGLNEWNPEWLAKNIGAYYYGQSDPTLPKSSPKSAHIKIYVEHTSWDVRHDRDFL